MSGAARATTALREQLASGCVVAAGCFDAFSARLAEQAGFRALHLTGFGVEATQLGAPDLGLMTMTELASHAARMSAAVGVPVLADVDTGFGGVLNVQRTVREMERAGVAGIHIEDQTLPKHCPLISGRTVVDRGEALERVVAACEARTDPDLVIVARTDADTLSFAESVQRCNLYLQAGADMVMPIVQVVDGVPWATISPHEQMAVLRRLTAEIEGPVMGMGDAPPVGYTTDDLAEAGMAFVMYAADALSAAADAMAATFAQILRDGNVARRTTTYSDPTALLRAVGLEEYSARERHLSAPRPTEPSRKEAS